MQSHESERGRGDRKDDACKGEHQKNKERKGGGKKRVMTYRQDERGKKNYELKRSIDRNIRALYFILRLVKATKSTAGKKKKTAVVH